MVEVSSVHVRPPPKVFAGAVTSTAEQPKHAECCVWCVNSYFWYCESELNSLLVFLQANPFGGANTAPIVTAPGQKPKADEEPPLISFD